jgi:hypothetical protein
MAMGRRKFDREFRKRATCSGRADDPGRAQALHSTLDFELLGRRYPSSSSIISDRCGSIAVPIAKFCTRSFE